MWNKKDNTFISKWSKKIRAINFLGGKCRLCGETEVSKLCFHHKDGQDKDFHLSVQNMRWSKMESELGKCDLLCMNCHNEFHFSNNTSIRHDTKKIFLEFKGIFSCEACGYNKSSCALDFHHEDPSTKSFSLGKVRLYASSVSDLEIQIKNELLKCKVLCKNCHCYHNFDKEKFLRLKDKIMERLISYKEKSKKIDRQLVIQMLSSGMKASQIAEKLGTVRSTITLIKKSILP